MSGERGRTQLPASPGRRGRFPCPFPDQQTRDLGQTDTPISRQRPATIQVHAFRVHSVWEMPQKGRANNREAGGGWKTAGESHAAWPSRDENAPSPTVHHTCYLSKAVAARPLLSVLEPLADLKGGHPLPCPLPTLTPSTSRLSSCINLIPLLLPPLPS